MSSLRSSHLGGNTEFPFCFCPLFLSRAVRLQPGGARPLAMVCERTLPTASPETPLSLGRARRSTKPSILLESLPWTSGTSDKHRKQEEKLPKRGTGFPQGKASQALPFSLAPLGWERAFCWAMRPLAPSVPPLMSAFFPLLLHPCPPCHPAAHTVAVKPSAMTRQLGDFQSSSASRAATEVSLGRKAPAGNPQLLPWETPESYHVFSGLKNTLSKQQKRTRRRVWAVSATKLLEGKLRHGMEGAKNCPCRGEMAKCIPCITVLS